jgi:carbonic anhydrase
MTGAPRLTPDEALRRLLDGNERFVSRRERHPNRDAELRLRLAVAQRPFAVIVGCSDSRVPPEVLFDEGLGDLFVIRNAGNIVDATALASVEYAVAHLGTPLVMVLGHERCGVVTAAVDVARDGQEVQGHLWSLIDAVGPALDQVADGSVDPVDATVCAHIGVQVSRLRGSAPILSRAVRSQAVRVVGARYDIEDGVVQVLV